MDLMHSRGDAAAIVGELNRRRASLRSLAPLAAPDERMPSLVALVDAVYRFDLDAPAPAPGQAAPAS